MTLLSLPPELLSKVFASTPIAGNDSLSNLFVCHNLYPIALEALYTRVRVRGRHRILAFTECLERKPELSPVVKSIELIPSGICNCIRCRERLLSTRGMIPLPELPGCRTIEVGDERAGSIISLLEVFTWVIRCHSLIQLSIINLNTELSPSLISQCETIIHSAGGWPPGLSALHLEWHVPRLNSIGLLLKLCRSWITDLAIHALSYPSGERLDGLEMVGPNLFKLTIRDQDRRLAREQHDSIALWATQLRFLGLCMTDPLVFSEHIFLFLEELDVLTTISRQAALSFILNMYQSGRAPNLLRITLTYDSGNSGDEAGWQAELLRALGFFGNITEEGVTEVMWKHGFTSIYKHSHRLICRKLA
jgi:hypothetical protein